MGLFSRRKKQQGPQSTVQQATDQDVPSAGVADFPPDAYESGYLPCARCGARLPLAELEPLRMTTCPECRATMFVPMKIDRFWLFRPLGGGGMGSVYRAYDVTVRGQVFAAKVLFRKGGDSSVSIEALLNEAKIGEVVGDHPSLVKCVASGHEGDEYYYVMEHVEGKRLDNLIRWRGRLAEKHVLLIAQQILGAEKHIYECGYLYRDMKPENIIVTTDGRAVLIDYGLCQTREESLAAADDIITGSPYYVPPERLWGIGEDAYSEIYSLGMVMYYALTGHTFFDSDEVESLAKRHVSKVRLTTASKMRGFRPELVGVLSKMIKQDYRERYRTYEEFEQVLQLLLA